MSFRLSQGIGHQADGTSGKKLRVGPKIEALFEADNTVQPGEPVMPGATANTDGKFVVLCTAADQHALRGVYGGEGGSGADTALAGVSGKDAVDGDMIWVTVFGKATAFVGGTTTAIAARLPLKVDAFVNSRSGFVGAADPADGIPSFAVGLEAQATTQNGIAKAVFVSCM